MTSSSSRSRTRSSSSSSRRSSSSRSGPCRRTLSKPKRLPSAPKHHAAIELQSLNRRGQAMIDAFNELGTRIRNKAPLCPRIPRTHGIKATGHDLMDALKGLGRFLTGVTSKIQKLQSRTYTLDTVDAQAVSEYMEAALRKRVADPYRRSSRECDLLVLQRALFRVTYGTGTPADEETGAPDILRPLTEVVCGNPLVGGLLDRNLSLDGVTIAILSMALSMIASFEGLEGAGAAVDDDDDFVDEGIGSGEESPADIWSYDKYNGDGGDSDATGA